MLNSFNTQSGRSCQHYLVTCTAVIIFQVLKAASIAVPSSSCYAIDNSSHIVDFTRWIGHAFEYEGKEADLVVRFCKDVESRSQMGYTDFGRFDAINYFVAGSGHVSFVQEYYKGDLMNCERTYDKMGRTAQVNIICGDCQNARCKDPLGCICNVTYESSCRVSVELAIPCEKQSPRVLQGLTVGFHPRSWEVVCNGMTQLGFEKAHNDLSFSTEHTHLTLYMTTIASLSKLVQNPTFKIYPENGLDVQLSGSVVTGKPATTLSPSTLIVEWRCIEPRNMPYEVEITVPIKNYEPVHFSLAKSCGYNQNEAYAATKGWAVFGIISFSLFILFTLFCCGGFLYRVRFQNQHGLDAMPGVAVLSECLQTASTVTNRQGRAEVSDSYDPFVNQTTACEPPPDARASSWRSAIETRYGSV